jgi:hypothetical protein
MNDSQLIDELGGTVAVARLCQSRGGRQISPQAVTQWRSKGIPPARRQLLLLLRPDLAERLKMDRGNQ